MSTRSYLSIGDVLTLLRQEFPDVTISKIRFLESQGLVNPERTPSGYRKFYEHDVERLRWVLRQQREHFLPLKVIKDRLEDDPAGAVETPAATVPGDTGGGVPSATEPVLVGQRTAARRTTVSGAQPAAGGVGEGSTLPGIERAQETRASHEGTGSTAATASERTSRKAVGSAPATAPTPDEPAAGPGSPAGPSPARSHGSATRAASAAGAATRSDKGAVLRGGRDALAAAGQTVAAVGTTAVHAAAPASPRSASGPTHASAGSGVPGGSSPAPTPAKATPAAARGAGSVPVDSGGASLSQEELCASSGLDAAAIRELQEFGLLRATMVAGMEHFDEDSLTVARVAARFAEFGVEPRHLRLYKNAADREAGFVEQLVVPLVRQRNPDARARAVETAEEVTRLGQQVRGSLLRTALQDLLNG